MLAFMTFECFTEKIDNYPISMRHCIGFFLGGDGVGGDGVGGSGQMEFQSIWKDSGRLEVIQVISQRKAMEE